MEISRDHGRVHIFFDSDDEDAGAVAMPNLAEEAGPEERAASSSDDTIAYDVDSYCQEKNVDVPKRRRSKTAKSATWKRNISRLTRQSGKSYVGAKGVVSKRAMGPPCIAGYCTVIGNKCREISEHERALIFRNFWLLTWPQRKTYVNCCVHRFSDGPVRTNNKWTLKASDGTSFLVCRKLVASTLAIPERTLNTWLGRKAKAGPAQSKAAKTGKNAGVSDADRRFVEEWLMALPTIPSHYCRNTPSYQDKRFLEPNVTVAALHRKYKEAAENQQKRAVSIASFTNAFSRLQFSVFKPKKDQCSTCLEGKYGHISPEDLEAHKMDAKTAQQEHKDDEALTVHDETTTVWTMDLQAVQPCPKTNASAMFYKQKLALHNLTFFCKETKDAFCYLWTEAEGELTAEAFTSIQQHHFRRLLREPRYAAVKQIILYSDGCTYQNRNVTVANGFLNLAMGNKISVVQKFLVKGHTMMEVDSVHATIQRKTNVAELTIPRDFVTIARTARIHPRPYEVQMLNHRQFKKMAAGYMNSIRPGRVAGDPTVFDIRAMMFTPDGTVQYKTRFTDQWRNLPQVINLDCETYWTRMYAAPLSITKRKYDDLQALKAVLPNETHPYYDGLAHTDA